jgi:hypothetical protein
VVGLVLGPFDTVDHVSAGLLLGRTYLVSGWLGLPIGIYAGFDFVSGYVFPIASDPSVPVISLCEWSCVAHWPGRSHPDRSSVELPASISFSYTSGKRSVAQSERAGEFNCTDEASDFAETGAE